MTCEDVFSPPNPNRKRTSRVVDLHRFEELHQDGRKLIDDWAKRATSKRKRLITESFELFIFGWIAFNGWASCVTQTEDGTAIIEALCQDAQLAKDFEEAKKHDFQKAMKDFHSMWPIFRASGNSYMPDYEKPRSEVVAELKKNGGHYKPYCAFRHKEDSQEIPLDWAHTICAIYQVRCNLFHGSKGLHCENDVDIVSKAYRALACLLQDIVLREQALD